MKNILIIILIFIHQIVVAQDKAFLKDYHAFLKEKYDDRYKDKGDFYPGVDSLNFASLWLPGSADVEGNFFTSKRPEFIGYIGENYQRLQIHFIEIIRNTDDPSQYYVYGKSKVKDNICSFQGTIEIKLIREYALDTFPGEDFLVDMSKVKKQGILIGEYNFYEDQSQKHVGKFSGRLITNFYLDEENKVKYNAIKAFSDFYSNNVFKGTWTSYSTGKAKTCNWGEFRIPDSGDLDVGAGFFSPNEKYITNGWENYHQDKTEWWE